MVKSITMKKLLIIISFIFLACTVNAQSKYRKETTGLTSGHLMCIGGVAFSTAGFLTPANFTSYSAANATSAYNMNNQTLPFWSQGPRATAIVVGIGVTITGLSQLISKR